MDNRVWNILCWNICGINASSKWDAIRNKIEESSCSIVYLQETKREHFDISYIRKFAPKRFDSFDFIPSSGASGGLLILWCSSAFRGAIIEKHQFAITASFTSMHNGDSWQVSNIYGPCDELERSTFICWLRDCEVNDSVNWIFLGDFNFYRSLENRNRPGGNLNDTLIFNDAIDHLGLIELPLKGRAFTWSNMQSDPLLEQLDWFFTSPNWTFDFPNTEVLPMARITSDHIPCRVAISTKIPRSNVFRFENFWVEHEGFLNTVQNCWTQPINDCGNSARAISLRFKKLRSDLKVWSKSLSNHSLIISNCNSVISFLDGLEDQRLLFNPEMNLRNLVKSQLQTLLHYKKEYWRKRFTNNKVKFGDECTKFFHAMATISYRRNAISQVKNENGIWVQDHEGKAGILWNTFKNRMGISSEVKMHFDLHSILTPRGGDLELLVQPIQCEEIDRIIKQMPTDKAPGPDGFNGLFLKKCWPIVKGDFYTLSRLLSGKPKHRKH